MACFLRSSVISSWAMTMSTCPSRRAAVRFSTVTGTSSKSSVNPRLRASRPVMAASKPLTVPRFNSLSPGASTTTPILRRPPSRPPRESCGDVIHGGGSQASRTPSVARTAQPRAAVVVRVRREIVAPAAAEPVPPPLSSSSSLSRLSRFSPPSPSPLLSPSPADGRTPPTPGTGEGESGGSAGDSSTVPRRSVASCTGRSTAGSRSAVRSSSLPRSSSSNSSSMACSAGASPSNEARLPAVADGGTRAVPTSSGTALSRLMPNCARVTCASAASLSSYASMRARRARFSLWFA